MGASLVGTCAEIVTIEARFTGKDRGRTEVVLTGLPDPVIRESRGRLVCALAENGLRLPPGQLFLNLVPAGRKKSGEILDLALVLGAAGAGGHLDARALQGILFLGEVGIDGTLHAVPGGLAAALAAREAGIGRVIAPGATAEEAACVPGLEVWVAGHLSRVLAHLTHKEPVLPRARAPEPLHGRPDGPSLDDVRGQAAAKYALAVAAAGGHGILFIGPPGAGKSMLARRLLSLLEAPDQDERLEITRALSASGRWPGGLATTRPFRAPHHTTSYAGLVGGGPRLTPGEITLAHRGVLFLDELPEFRREALEALRQPLESGTVLIARAERRVELPARFQLVAAMNPCPCGYLGHARVPCSCPPSHVARYRRRISGPLLDRIDLRIEVAPPTLDDIVPLRASGDRSGSHSPGEASEQDLRRSVERARAIRRSRGSAVRNVDLDGADLDRLAPVEGEARALLAAAAGRRDLSARALQSLRRVARTVADLEGTEHVTSSHIAQALALRAPI